MAEPLVSILTATFEALAGLRSTVRSVAEQTHPGVEHIVVDGGSTDGTAEYLSSTGGNVKWISEPDSGIAEALNKGLHVASGIWVLVLHAEDTLLNPKSVESAAPFLESTADIVSFDVLFATEHGSSVRKSRGFSPRINLKTTIPHQGAFCRRALFDRIGEFDTSLQVEFDYEFFLRAKRAGTAVDAVHQIVSRMPDTGISSRRDWDSLRARFEEERMIHNKHAVNPAHRLLYMTYWPAYLAYRRAVDLVERDNPIQSDSPRTTP